MRENRNLNRIEFDVANQDVIHFPYEELPDPSGAPEFYARVNDDIESIATPFAHDEQMRQQLERFSEEVWRAKIHDMIGREAMLLKFDEIDSDYDLAISNFLINPKPRLGEIQLGDEDVSPEILSELAVLFQLANEHEAILEVERLRIDEENRERIKAAQDFFIRGLIASVPDNERHLFDATEL